jgi:hypothetical protein
MLYRQPLVHCAADRRIFLPFDGQQIALHLGLAAFVVSSTT